MTERKIFGPTVPSLERESSVEEAAPAALFDAYWKTNIKFPQVLFDLIGPIELGYAGSIAGIPAGDLSTKHGKLSAEQVEFVLSQMEKVHEKHGVSLEETERWEIGQRIRALYFGALTRSIVQRLFLHPVAADRRDNFLKSTGRGPFEEPGHKKPHGEEWETDIQDDMTKIWNVLNSIFHEVANSKEMIDIANQYRRAEREKKVKRSEDIASDFRTRLLLRAVDRYMELYPNVDQAKIEYILRNFISGERINKDYI